MLFPHSLGMFYSAATEFCGFKPNYDEGKTMGLAPTGDPGRYYEVVDSMVKVDDDAVVELSLDWFDFPLFNGNVYGQKFIDVFGPKRSDNEEIMQSHRDVAAAFQAVLEKNILAIAKYLSDKTKCRHLIYAGGVALNSVANGRIIREGLFDDIFVMPGAGDNGTAIGAAAYVYSRVSTKSQHRIRHSTPFLGRNFSNEEIKSALISSKVTFHQTDDITGETAKHLHMGKIVGWFQGRSEFGPRALGGRSILADPTDHDMKRRINADVKHREPFRPFAPSVLSECARDYFEIDLQVPYMLKVAYVREEVRNMVPAIVHVDGSARLQTVDKDTNPRYHEMIKKFGELSGHPLVLNTSFNVMGEPIVQSPADALRCFFSTGLDILAIGDFIVEKSL